MDIGKNIRIRRKQLKMTQEQLALAVDSDAGNLSRIENGKQNLPLDKIELYARALNCKPSDLFTNIDEEIDLNVPSGFIKIPFINGEQAKKWYEIKSSSHLNLNISEWAILPANISPFSFAFRVEDTRMMPEMKTSDVLIIDPDLRPEAGDIVMAAKNKHESVLGRFRLRGVDDSGTEQFELQPFNDDFETLQSKRYDLKIIGVMVEHRKFRTNNHR